MGKLEVTVRECCKAGALLIRETKQPKAKCSIRTTLSLQEGTISTSTCVFGLSTQGGQARIDPSSCSPGPHFTTDGVRFSHNLDLSLHSGDGGRVLGRAVVCLQNCVQGVTRHARIAFYPDASDVSDDYPATTVVGEFRIDVLALNFGHDQATLNDPLLYLDEEQRPNIEKLKLLMVATGAASELCAVDVVVAQARNETGWEVCFSRYRAKINHVDPKVCTVRVVVHGGNNMPREESTFIDSYLKVAVVGGATFGDTFQTAVHKDSQNPKFNDETFDIALLGGESDSLRFSLWDYDVTNDDDLIGDVLFPLSLLCAGQPVKISLPFYSSYKSANETPLVEVSLTAIGFGHSPDVYGSILTSALCDDKRRLLAYFERYDRAQRKNVFVDVAKYSMTPGALDDYFLRLSKRFGLEPGKGIVSLRVLSVQEPSHIHNEGDHGHRYVHLPGTFHSSMSNLSFFAGKGAERISAAQCCIVEGPNMFADHRVVKPLTIDVGTPDTTVLPVTLNLVICSADGSCYSTEAVAMVPLSQLQQGVEHIRTYPLVYGGRVSATATLSLSTEWFTGSKTAVSIEHGQQKENHYMRLISKYYEKYCNAQLASVPSIVFSTPNLEEHVSRIRSTHGPEPFSFRLQLGVIKCSNLPKVDLVGGCDPYVKVTCCGVSLQTKRLNGTVNPVFNEMFDLDLLKPAEDVVTIAVMDYDSNSSDDEVAGLKLPVSMLAFRARTVPEGGEFTIDLSMPQELCSDLQGELATSDKVIKALKRNFGTITLTVRCIGFSDDPSVVGPAVASKLADEELYSKRLSSVLRYYNPSALPTMHCLLFNKSLDFKANFETALATYGFEPGTAKATIVVRSIFGLKKSGKPVKAKPYLEVHYDTSLAPYGRLQSRLRDKLLLTTASPKERVDCHNLPPNGSSTTFDVENERDHRVRLTLMDDVTGTDYCFGDVLVSLNQQTLGVPRQCTLPIVSKTDNNRIVGQVSLTIETSTFGSLFESRDLIADNEIVSSCWKRILAMTARYESSRVRDLDWVVGTISPQKLPAHLASLVQKYGPEPGTFKVQVTVHRCKGLPSVELGGCDPYISITGGSDDCFVTKTVKRSLDPTFEETFELDIRSPSQDAITFSLWDYDSSSDDDLVASVTVPIRTCQSDGCPDEKLAKTLYLSIADYQLRRKLGTSYGGSVSITVRTIGLPITQCSPSQRKDLPQEQEFRDRILQLLIKYDNQRIGEVERLLWDAPTFEESLARVTARYGAETGKGVVAVTVVSLQGFHMLTRNLPGQLPEVKASPLANATPYVVLSYPGQPQDNKEIRTKTLRQSTTNVDVQQAVSKTYEANETFQMDLAHADRTTLTFTVFNDVIGCDDELGSAQLTLTGLSRGAKRVVTCPIVWQPGLSVAHVAGYMTLLLQVDSQNTSFPEVTQEELSYEPHLLTNDEELQFTRDLVALFEFRDRSKLSNISLMHTPHEMKLRTEKAKVTARRALESQYGTMPGTFVMRLEILEFKGIPKCGIFGTPMVFRCNGQEASNARLNISESSVNFGAAPLSFRVDLKNAGDCVVVDVVPEIHRRHADPEIICSCVIPSRLCDTTMEVPVTRTFPLLIHAGTPQCSIVPDGVVTFRVVALSAGVGGLSYAEQFASFLDIEEQWRRRFYDIVKRSAPSELNLVESYVCGRGPSQWKAKMDELTSAYGEESGNTSIQIRVISVADFVNPEEARNPYVKVYLNRAACHRYTGLKAETAWSPSANSLKPQSDMIVVKAAVQSMFGSSKPIGRGFLPVNVIGQIALEASLAGQPDDSTEIVQTVWLFNDDLHFVGTVTLAFKTHGLAKYFKVAKGNTIAASRRPVFANDNPSSRQVLLYREYVAASMRSHVGVSFNFFSRLEAVNPMDALHLGEAGFSCQLPGGQGTACAAMYLHVVGCRGLPRMDTFGTSDTFVEIGGRSLPHPQPPLSFVVPSQHRTNIVSGTLNPTFRFHQDDFFVSYLVVKDSGADRRQQRMIVGDGGGTVQLTLRDKDPAGDEDIGTVELSLGLLSLGLWRTPSSDLPALYDHVSKLAPSAPLPSNVLSVPILLQEASGLTCRGELLLTTSVDLCHESIPFVIPPLEPEGQEAIRAVVHTATATYKKHKALAELRELHTVLYGHCFKEGDEIGAEILRSKAFVERLFKEFGRN